MTMSCRKEQGYIYIWMLFAVMLAGIMLAAAGVIWRTEMKREKELELLFTGDQFRRAIESYYNDSKTEGGVNVSRYPVSLEQLLKDERSLVVKRHLRRIYIDPMTNSRDWGLIRQQDGGITGVYSLSKEAPARRANFPADYAVFDKAESYQDWKFIHTASNTAGGQGGQRPPGNGEGLPDGSMMRGVPGAGLNSLQQNPSAPGVNASPAAPASQPPSDNNAF